MKNASTVTLLQKFENLQVWSAGDQRAPHKPLLALWAIGRCLAGKPRLAPYKEADHALRTLLREFGPHRVRTHTEHPFWRLRNNGVWEVERADQVTTTSKGDAHRRSLLDNNIRAGFPRDVHAALTADGILAKKIAHALVDAHFPESLHAEILNSAGIEPAYVTTRRKPRDPRFPEQVLEAYGHRCAVCGYAVRLNEKPIGLEAAHIKWHGARGPDVVVNALSLRLRSKSRLRPFRNTCKQGYGSGRQRRGRNAKSPDHAAGSGPRVGSAPRCACRSADDDGRDIRRACVVGRHGTSAVRQR